MTTILKKTNLYLICLYFVIIGCQPKFETIPPDTNLYVNIKDQAGQIIPGAVVAIFEDAQAYNLASGNFTTTDCIRVDTSDDQGNVVFEKLPTTTKTYYLAAYHQVSTTIANQRVSITHDNAVYGYQVSNLYKGAKTYISLVLSPAEAFVTFWAGNTLDRTIPIKLRVNKDSVGTLRQTVALVSTDFSPNAITLKLRRGINTYIAQNASGCTTIDTLYIKGGETRTPINVNICQTGIVGFWTVAQNANLPIDIVINSNTYIGRLQGNTAGTIPQSCNTPGVLNYSLNFGIHTYTATTTGCAWTGTFTISGTGCSASNIIKLDACR